MMGFDLVGTGKCHKDSHWWSKEAEIFLIKNSIVSRKCWDWFLLCQENNENYSFFQYIFQVGNLDWKSADQYQFIIYHCRGQIWWKIY